MKQLTSISLIDKKYETAGSKPIRILASDLEHYICKYPFFPNDSKLVNEYLGHQFATIWGIRVPEMASIQIAREHLPETMLDGQLTYIAIESPVIGFRQINDVVEIKDHISDGISNTDLAKYQKDEFLQIALFDIWLSNDDRNCGNTNLLLQHAKNKFQPIAIDHEKIFNTGDLKKGIYELSYEDSLFYSKLYNRLFSKSKKTSEYLEVLCGSLHTKIDNCKEKLEEIITGIPTEWISNKVLLSERLINNIFADKWLKKVENTFRAFASQTIITK